MIKQNRFIKIIILVLAFYCFSFAQTGYPKPCSSPEAKQFNFWLGKWHAEWRNKEDSILTGSNHIVSILGGCVIEENFDGSPGTNLIGKSFSVYNPNKKIWQQTWVDNQGSYLDFTGGFKEGKMILSMKGKDKKGSDIILRMVYYNITNGSFDWDWEKSTDNGKNWNIMWKIHYTRISKE